jgi:hypothetical protein
VRRFGTARNGGAGQSHKWEIAERFAKMTEIVNLNKARKAKRKQKQIETSQKNRVIYGLPGKTRKVAQDAQKRLQAQWDGKRLNPVSPINGVDE